MMNAKKHFPYLLVFFFFNSTFQLCIYRNSLFFLFKYKKFNLNRKQTKQTTVFIDAVTTQKTNKQI